MVGAGNDFLVIENLSKTDPQKLAVAMCARQTGVGADGLLLLGTSKKADYQMRIINSDGSEAEMCGNGVRCLAVYITHFKKPKKKLFTIETLAGMVEGQANRETARVHLSDPKDYRPDLPLEINGRSLKANSIDTGVPHLIIFVDGLDNIAVNELGRQLRHHAAFEPRGTNVNFVEQKNETLVAVRTYERGVEAETNACGTGAVASGIVGFLLAHPQIQTTKKAVMNVLTKSREILEISFQINNGRIFDVWLKGSGKIIAQGEYYV